MFYYYLFAGDYRYMLYSIDFDAFYFDLYRMFLCDFVSVELG
ncbi:DcaP family trimeric outer membrane transporter, partial [Acinetobacter baumannii]